MQKIVLLTSLLAFGTAQAESVALKKEGRYVCRNGSV